MVEVTESSPIGAVPAVDPRGDHAKREKPEDEQEPSRRRARKPRSIPDVAFIMGIPADEMTPRVHEALTIIMAEFDRNRDELERIREHATYLEDLADRHPYLPVINQRALLGRLAWVLARAEQAETVHGFLVFHVLNAGDIRRRHGRVAAQAALAVAARAISEGLRESDVVGSLGGDDFGVVLALTEGEAAVGKAGELLAAIQAETLSLAGESIALEATWGLHAFGPGGDPEAVIAAADKDMTRRRSRPSATDGDNDKEH